MKDWISTTVSFLVVGFHLLTNPQDVAGAGKGFPEALGALVRSFDTPAR